MVTNEFRRTDSMLYTLIQYIIGTGLLTTIASIIYVVLVSTPPSVCFPPTHCNDSTLSNPTRFCTLRKSSVCKLLYPFSALHPDSPPIPARVVSGCTPPRTFTNLTFNISIRELVFGHVSSIFNYISRCFADKRLGWMLETVFEIGLACQWSWISISPMPCGSVHHQQHFPPPSRMHQRVSRYAGAVTFIAVRLHWHVATDPAWGAHNNINVTSTIIGYLRLSRWNISDTSTWFERLILGNLEYIFQ